MGWRLTLAPEAETELRALIDYLRALSPRAADRHGRALVEHIFSLNEHPHRGAPVSGRPGIRKLIHNNIIVFYQVDDATHRIRILRLWDARQDPKSLKL